MVSDDQLVMSSEQVVEKESVFRAIDPDLLSEELENLRTSRIEIGTGNSLSPAIKSRSASIGPGYLHCLKGDEKRSMYQLWAILFEYFQNCELSAERETDAAKLKEFAVGFLASEPRNGDSFDYGRALQHEILLEMFQQAATDDLDTLLLRFLRARKWKLPDAFAMLIECLYWRHNFNVVSLTRKGEAGLRPELLEAGKCYVWGEDREGRIVCYVRARLHDKQAQSLEESAAYSVWCLETGRLLRRHDEQLLTLVIDLEGAGMASFDLPYVQFVLRCLQDYYPESLGACLILNAPWIFWAFWAAVKPFLDPVVASKISFIKGSELTDYFHKESIPRDFPMGTSPFVYDYRSYRDGAESPVGMKDADSRVLASEAEMDKMKHDFIELSLGIRLQLEQGEPNVHQLRQLTDKRNQLKCQMRWENYARLARDLPTNMYHRWGVLDRRGYVDWEAYVPSPKPTVKNELPSPSLTRQ